MEARIKMQTMRNADVLAGVLAGWIGGIVMELLFMLYTASLGQGFWTPLEAIGATFYGSSAFLGGAGPVISGLLLHLVIAGGLGAIFGASLNPSTSTGGATAIGVVYGIVTWAVMTFIVLNIVNLPMRSFVAGWSGIWFLVHLVFGVCLGATPGLRAALAGGRPSTNPRSTDYLDRAA